MSESIRAALIPSLKEGDFAAKVKKSPNINKVGESLRGWLILAGVAVLLIILPLIAMGGYFGTWGRPIGQTVLTIMLIIGIMGTGLFGYICIRAQARKWGAGLILLAVLFVIAIYCVWVGHLPFL